MDRHSRQARLADVGPAGQARIGSAVVEIPTEGLAAEVAARYLAGAGVRTLRVKDVATASAAQAVDASVKVEVDPLLPELERASAPLESFVDPSARAIAEGAWIALRALREVLVEGGS